MKDSFISLHGGQPHCPYCNQFEWAGHLHSCIFMRLQASTPAGRDVIAERERQKNVEGWTPEHDDHHDEGELALAASCYAASSATTNYEKGRPRCPRDWPWGEKWWKPKDRRRDLIRAGALILAEIDRLDRVASKVMP